MGEGRTWRTAAASAARDAGTLDPLDDASWTRNDWGSLDDRAGWGRNELAALLNESMADVRQAEGGQGVGARRQGGSVGVRGQGRRGGFCLRPPGLRFRTRPARPGRCSFSPARSPPSVALQTRRDQPSPDNPSPCARGRQDGMLQARAHLRSSAVRALVPPAAARRAHHAASSSSSPSPPFVRTLPPSARLARLQSDMSAASSLQTAERSTSAPAAELCRAQRRWEEPQVALLKWSIVHHPRAGARPHSTGRLPPLPT